MRASTHWLHQRISAVIICLLIPGFWWFFYKLNMSSYSEFYILVSRPIVVLPLTFLFFFIIYHARLGLQVVLEDYVLQHKRKILILCVDIILALMFIIFSFSTITLLKGGI